METGQNEEKKDEDKPRPNPALIQGATLPTKMGEFPSEMYGMPIEDIDEYYHNKYVRPLATLHPLSGLGAVRRFGFC